MKAVVYTKEGKAELCEREKPSLLKDTDAIVRVTLTTICSSDIHILHGAVPKAARGVILGHEFVGVVEQTGPAVKGVAAGDRVAVNVESFCGSCFYCNHGFVNNCEDSEGGWMLGCRIDGGQAEYVRIPHANQGLNRIPEGVSDEAALFTGDLLSTGYWAAGLGEIKKGDTVLVLGAGPAGLCTMMAAQLYQPKHVIAADTDEFRLKTAFENGLADIVVNPKKEDLEKFVKQTSAGRGADCVIEAAGGENTFELAWKAARPNGIVVLEAMYEKNQVLPLPQMYGKNLIFKTGGVDACRCDEILRLMKEGKLNGECLITHRFPFSKIEEAYRIFEQKQDHIIKCAIYFGGLQTPVSEISGKDIKLWS